MELLGQIRESIILAQEKRRFPKTLQESGIQAVAVYDKSIRKIGQEGSNALVACVSEQEFLRFITSRSPQEILYQMVNMRDEFMAAEFYAKLRGRTFIRTTGLLEDVSGAETLSTRLGSLSYRVVHHHTYEQPWGRLTHSL